MSYPHWPLELLLLAELHFLLYAVDKTPSWLHVTQRSANLGRF